MRPRKLSCSRRPTTTCIVNRAGADAAACCRGIIISAPPVEGRTSSTVSVAAVNPFQSLGGNPPGSGRGHRICRRRRHVAVSCVTLSSRAFYCASNGSLRGSFQTEEMARGALGCREAAASRHVGSLLAVYPGYLSNLIQSIRLLCVCISVSGLNGLECANSESVTSTKLKCFFSNFWNRRSFFRW